ncbi:MAG: NAD(P)H-dependent oxidoreductase [Oscillospiraceae bacterium]|jgi:multimeric flavodoxin WrbA|nr:NAD(P)H-dependent oxidoreductase [Oscillospiraceae bacterium]
MFKKKAILFFGSANKNGFTFKILNKILKKLDEKYNFLLIDAYEKKVHPCIGCEFCKNNFRCKFKDFEDIDKNIVNAELIIVASPVYNLSIPSTLKAIFDRFQPYYFLNSSDNKKKIKKKRAILVLTCGSDETDFTIVQKQISASLSLINSKIDTKIFWKNTDKNSKITSELINQISNLK